MKQFLRKEPKEPDALEYGFPDVIRLNNIFRGESFELHRISTKENKYRLYLGNKEIIDSEFIFNESDDSVTITDFFVGRNSYKYISQRMGLTILRYFRDYCVLKNKDLRLIGTLNYGLMRMCYKYLSPRAKYIIGTPEYMGEDGKRKVYFNDVDWLREFGSIEIVMDNGGKLLWYGEFVAQDGTDEMKYITRGNPQKDKVAEEIIVMNKKGVVEIRWKDPNKSRDKVLFKVNLSVFIEEIVMPVEDLAINKINRGISDLSLKEIVKLVGTIFNNRPLLLNELIEGYSAKKYKLLGLYGKVAKLSKEVANKVFGIVLYPASGSDISAAIFYADRIVTIDNQDIFSVKPDQPFFTADVHKGIIIFDRKEILKEQIKGYLERKFIAGFHSSGIKQGIIEYLAELLLLGVDLDTLRILEDRFVSNNRVTTVEFIIRANDGIERKIVHTHIRHVFDGQSLPEHIHNELKKIMGDRTDIVLLSKAGADLKGDKHWETPISTILPVGTTVVSDSYFRKEIFKQLDVSKQDLKDLGLSAYNKYGYAHEPERMHFYNIVAPIDQRIMTIFRSFAATTTCNLRPPLGLTKKLMWCKFSIMLSKVSMWKILKGYKKLYLYIRAARKD